MDGYDTQKVQYPEESKLTIVHPEESKLTIVRRSYEGKLLAQKRGSGSNDLFPIDRMGCCGRL